jgi:hypothetical protein
MLIKMAISIPVDKRPPHFWGLLGVAYAVCVSTNILFKATYVWALRLSWQLFSPGPDQNCPSCSIPIKRLLP